MSLFGGFAKPGYGLDIVLLYAKPVSVHPTKIALGACISLLGGFAIPGYGLDIVLLYAKPICVQRTKIVLGCRIPPLGSSFVMLDGFLIFSLTVQSSPQKGDHPWMVGKLFQGSSAGALPARAIHRGKRPSDLKHLSRFPVRVIGDTSVFITVLHRCACSHLFLQRPSGLHALIRQLRRRGLL